MCDCTWNAKHGSRVPSLCLWWCCWIQSQYGVFCELSLFLTARCWLVEETLLLCSAAFAVVSVHFVRWWGGSNSRGSCRRGTQKIAENIISTWSTCTTCWWQCANGGVCNENYNQSVSIHLSMRDNFHCIYLPDARKTISEIQGNCLFK